MNLNEIQLPERPAELDELEARRRKLRKQRKMAEDQIREAELARSRALIAGEDQIDKLASELVSGQRDSISRVALPEEIKAVRDRLATYQKAETELTRRIAQHRERHNRAIAAAYRPAHRAAMARILAALEELVLANAEEAAVRDAVPGLAIYPGGFPNVGRFDGTRGPAERWRDYCFRQHPDLAERDEPEPESKPRLFQRRSRGRSNGAGAAAPMAAKGTD